MSKRGEIDYLGAIGPEARLHAANKPFSDPDCGAFLARMGQVMLLLPDAPCRVLDLGCGTGWTSVLLAQRGFDVVGCDLAPDMIDCANQLKERVGVPNVQFRVADYESLTVDAPFDGVVFFDSLHHAEDERLALECAHRALRPGGICVVSEPGEGHGDLEVAKQVTQKYGVNEKDMPPWHVRRLGDEIGFDTVGVHPHASHMMSFLHPTRIWGRRGRAFKWLQSSHTLRCLAFATFVVAGRNRYGVTVLKKRV